MSRTADAAVGMMDAAYFVGRKELLEFLNTLLGLNLLKIEQTASGAVACQIFDIMYPGTIPMSKVNWEARSDYEFVNNYKLLQNAFNKHNVQRFIDVNKLIRAKYQDNLEFMQWFKAFYDNSGVFQDEEYNPSAVRARGKGGKKYNTQFGTGNGGVGVTKKTSFPLARPPQASKARPTTTTKPQPSSPRTSRPLRERPNAAVHDRGSGSSASNDARVMADATLMKKNAELTTKVEELEVAVLDIEKERDFYFEKLRNVEVLLQVHQEKGSDEQLESHSQLLDKVFKVLYATAEDNLVVDDYGELIDASELGQNEPVDAV